MSFFGIMELEENAFLGGAESIADIPGAYLALNWVAEMRYLLLVIALLVNPTYVYAGQGMLSGTGEIAGWTTGIHTADFFHLAIVPDQTVSTNTFEVQAIAEALDPATTLTPPIVIDASGVSHTMSPQVLKWPGTIEDSVTIWSAVIPLVSNHANNLKLVSGTKEIAFAIQQKSAPSVLTVTNATELVNNVKAAITDPTIDVIQVAYNEADLGAVLNGVGADLTNHRTTWLTVKPAAGSTVSWIQDTAATRANERPHVTFLNIDGITFGSDTSDGAAGTYYVEPNHHVWISHSEFRAKYKYTWDRATPITAATVPNVRGSLTEGGEVYFTDCLWDGTAVSQATNAVELARDLRFNSHRGDINNFGKVVLNVYGKDIDTVRNNTNTDSFHNDIFQIWGNVATSDLVFKGIKIVSPHIPANIQPLFFDHASAPDYSYILVDSVTVEGASTGTSLQAQVAGKTANSRISNYSIPDQNLTFRYDSTLPNGAFCPNNVYVYNMKVKRVLYVAPRHGKNAAYFSKNVSDANDISNKLNAESKFSGVRFINTRVASGP